MTDIMQAQQSMQEMSQDQLKQLQDLAGEYNTGATSSGLNVPKMAVSYADESPNYGKWVIGEEKDENGNIVEHGTVMYFFIPLAVFKQFSYYPDKKHDDGTKPCRSNPFRTWDESVKGSEYGYNCLSKTNPCPLRDKSRKQSCKMQLVVFGLAYDEQGQEHKCVTYMKGKTMMEFQDYIQSATQKGPKGVPLPLFLLGTALSTERGKYSGRTYWIGKFTLKSVLIDQMSRLQAYADEILQAAQSMGEVEKQPGEVSNPVDPDTTQEQMQSASEQMDDLPDGFGPPQQQPQPQAAPAQSHAGQEQPSSSIDKLSSELDNIDFGGGEQQGDGAKIEVPF